jgi:thiol-disulfide isomerase/thioredoxin
MILKKLLMILTVLLYAGGALAQSPASSPAPSPAPSPAAKTLLGRPAESQWNISFGVGWITSYEHALKLAQARKSPLLMFFTAEWCPPCRMMHAQTFPDPRIQTLLSRMACLRVDIDSNHELAMTWRVSGIPRIIILNVAGQVIGDHLGFQSAEQLEPLLQDALLHANEILPDAPKSPAQVTQAREQRINAQLAAAQSDGLTSAVIELFSLPKPEMREKGLEQLVRGGERTKQVLLRLLGDERLAIRVLALETLEKLGETKLGFDPWGPRKDRSEILARVLAARRARPEPATPVKAPD